MAIHVAFKTIAPDWDGKIERDGTGYPGADGAAGFYVNNQKKLIIILGAQYSQAMTFDNETRMRMCQAG